MKNRVEKLCTWLSFLKHLILRTRIYVLYICVIQPCVQSLSSHVLKVIKEALFPYCYIRARPSCMKEQNHGYLLSHRNISIKLSFRVNKMELFQTIPKSLLSVQKVFVCSKLFKYQNITLIFKKIVYKNKNKTFTLSLKFLVSKQNKTFYAGI